MHDEDQMKQLATALMTVVVMMAGPVLPATATARASASPVVPAITATPAQLANCEANVIGVLQPGSVKQEACEDVIADLASIGPKLGLPVIPLVSKPKADGFQLNFAATPYGPEPAAVMETVFNGASPCFISIFPDTWQTMRTDGAAWGTDVYASFAHEAVHCYQLSVWGSLAVFSGAPHFIAEGSVEYLGVEAVGYDADPGRWEQWFNPAGPQPSLLAPSRSFDAIGWYAVVAQVEGSLWPKMATAWRAYMKGGALAFIYALDGDSEGVETTLGPSLLNDRAWGEPWFTEGIGIPTAAFADPAIGVTAGALPAWSGEVDRVGSLASNLVQIRVTGGYAAVHDYSDHQLVGFTDGVFCTNPDGCPSQSEACPNASPIKVTPLVPPYILALGSTESGAKFTVAPYKSVASIPASISPCDLGTVPPAITTAALAHFSNSPCALLTDQDWQAVTGIMPRDSQVEIATNHGGECEWNMTKAGPSASGTDTNYLLGEAGTQEGSWANFVAGAKSLAAHRAQEVFGLGTPAWCIKEDPKYPMAPTVAVSISAELNPDWALGVYASTCPSATRLAKEAYDRLEGYQ
jgi:hypothetical protein